VPGAHNHNDNLRALEILSSLIDGYGQDVGLTWGSANGSPECSGLCRHQADPRHVALPTQRLIARPVAFIHAVSTTTAATFGSDPRLIANEVAVLICIRCGTIEQNVTEAA
jgi:hypothetical protein